MDPYDAFLDDLRDALRPEREGGVSYTVEPTHGNRWRRLRPTSLARVRLTASAVVTVEGLVGSGQAPTEAMARRVSDTLDDRGYDARAEDNEVHVTFGESG